MRQHPAHEVIRHFRQAQAVLVLVVMEQVLDLAVADRDVEMRARPGAIRERLGHERRDHAHRPRDFRGGHFHHDQAVGRAQRIAVGVVHFELAVGIFVVDLIDIDAHGPQCIDHCFEERHGAREAFVVVAGLLQQVGIVGRAEAAVGGALEQHEFRFDARVHGKPALGERIELALQHHARTVLIRRAVDMAVTGHARKARHPWNDRQRRGIAHRHVVRTVRPHAETPQRKAGEARAFVQHHVEVLDGHGLGLRSAVNVDELRKDVFDLVVLQILSCRLG